MADGDVIELLQQDHDEVRQLFSRLDDASPQERGELFRTIVHELARHEAVEEAIVHPTARDEVPGGEEVARSVLEEENEAEQLMARMEHGPDQRGVPRGVPAAAERRARPRTPRGDQEWPRLRETLSVERLLAMGEGFSQLKERGPTRPHPRTPQTPEVRAVLAPSWACSTVRVTLPGRSSRADDRRLTPVATAGGDVRRPGPGSPAARPPPASCVLAVAGDRHDARSEPHPSPSSIVRPGGRR
ncbi:MAG TPA: hemerythrin domain-containing protein [Nitriliruptorales bacterium]|nr:hemerythrin domain-containing protein [Nitriliruptorales bacterium]